MVTGNDFIPVVVSTETTALKLKMFPIPLKACAGDPPIAERSATTVIPVLGGLGAGETSTVSATASPGCTLLGFAEPPPVRIVQLCKALLLFRGLGVPASKSLALSFVSRQPPFFLSAAVVFVSVGAAAEPSKQFAPS